MRSFFSTLLTAALLSLATISPAHAASVLDQDAFAPPPSGPPINGRIVTTFGTLPPQLTNAFVGQTITAGVAGQLLTIQLQGIAARQPDTIFGFTLFDGDLSAGGRAIGDVTGLLPLGAATSVIMDVSAFGYNVRPGQVFSFSLGILSGPPNASAVAVIGNFAGFVPPSPPPILDFIDYAGGVRLISNNGSPFVPQLTGDIGFRTFVEEAITGVPEPQSWAMMIFGFAAVGGAMRRRRARRVIMA